MTSEPQYTKILIDEEVIQLKNDGYRIYYRREGRETWHLWAEYKFSYHTALAARIADAILAELEWSYEREE